jgi:hypothetical protein
VPYVRVGSPRDYACLVLSIFCAVTADG